MTRIEGQSSLLTVGAFAAVWGLVAATSPGFMQWMGVHPLQEPVEGGLEWTQHLVLMFCLALWIAIVRRTGARDRPGWLAVFMLAQVTLILGEELDWGQNIGLRPASFHRNIRMFLRYYGVLQPWNDAIGTTAYLLWFVFVPMVPVARVQRWLAAAEPVRARIGDSLAVLAVPVLWVTLGAVLGAPQSIEFVQLGGYLVLASFSVRIARATGGLRYGAMDDAS